MVRQIWSVSQMYPLMDVGSVAHDLALVAPLLLHKLSGGATYFDFWRRCYAYGVFYSARRACAASARLCPPETRAATDRTSLLNAFVLAPYHTTTIPLFCTGASSIQSLSICMCAWHWIILRYPRSLRLPLVTPRPAICCFGRSYNFKSPLLQRRRRP